MSATDIYNRSEAVTAPRYEHDVYAAIDKLNSWVRSASARGWWSSPRRAIYDWKRHLIETAIKEGSAQLSAIYLSLTCRDCGGSGRYVDSYGEKFPHCRRCSNSGISKLQFVVSDIHGFKWHTPRDQAYTFRLPEDFWVSESLSCDWEPNGAGRDLDLIEVVSLLNLVEAQLPCPGSHVVYDGDYSYGESFHGKYKLNLGTSERACQLCGTESQVGEGILPMDGVHHHCIRGHFDWSAWACDGCKARYSNGTEIFAMFPVPEVAAHPEIQTWVSRRA